ncbi:MAG: glycosyltransferase family 4 protein [Actinomycetes bacterium]
MKVLVVMPGLNGQGGAEQSFAATAPWLMSQGVSLDLALFTDRRLLVPTVQEMGVTVHDLSSATGARGRAAALQALVERLQPDLVHATLYEAEVPALLASRRTGVPALVTWATTTQTSTSEGGVAAWKLKLVEATQAVLGRYARARYQAVTQGVANSRGQTLRVPASRIRVAERGRDAAKFAPVPAKQLAAVRADMGLRAEDQLVLSVARLEPAKGLERLLGMVDELVDAVPGAMVAIAGRDGSSGRRLRAQAEGLRHAERVRFLGHRDDIPVLLQAADCWVCTSHREGAAGAMLESWASGCPVVTVPVDGIMGVAVDGHNALVVEAGDLARAVTKVLEDPELGARLVDAGREDFAARFTVERSAEQLVDVYRWAAGEP